MVNSTLRIRPVDSSNCGPIGNSKIQQLVREQVSQVAEFDTLVLIQGESGSGKEVVARAVHNASPRHDKPFIPVNCGAIPADLLESELFGHEKGAFTGAISARKGRFEMAEGGTLFLDEIGDMSFNMQVKLLRVLQERCFERVGSNQTIQCNVRIVAATHRDLPKMIDEGSFRHDLYYRLNVFPITVPPLRDHLADLPELVAHLSERFKQRGMAIPRFTRTALEALQGYNWPGNVRELENILERLAITHGGKLVSAKDLPQPMAQDALGQGSQPIDSDDEISFLLRGYSEDCEESEAQGSPQSSADFDAGESEQMICAAGLTEGFDLKAHMQEIEKQYIVEALRRANGTVTQAAKILGLQRTTLAEKMKKLHMA